nr:hypothetical protein [Tanacetum cinerariifolium]
MKNVLKGLVKTRVKEQVSRILPRVEESVNTTLEAEVLTRSSHSSRIPILLPLTYQKWNSRRSLSKRWKEINKAILDTYRESTILKRRREDDDQEGPSAGPNRGSKRQKEGAEQASASTPSEKATKGAGESTTGTQSRQQSASQSAYAEEPVQTTYDYSRYTWVHFLKSKDEAPVVIIMFLKRITNDREDIGKLGAKGDIGFFIGYSADSCAYRIYNSQTKKIMETMNVSFDELSAMAFEQRSPKPGLQCMTSGQISSGLDLTYAPSTITKQQQTEGELDLLFEAMYNDYFGGQPSATVENVPPAQEPQVRQTSTASTTIADNVLIPTNSSSHATNTPITSQDVDELNPNMLNFGMIVTSNSVSTPQVYKGVNNDKVIAPGLFRINYDKVSREAKKVPNTVSANSRTKPITVSQHSVITKKGMNSYLNGLSSTGLDNTKTRRPQPRSNTKDDRVSSAFKSIRSMNKEVKVEEHHRNLLLSKKNKHSSSACNNSKIDSQDVISKVVCAKCKKCLNSVNHDVCLNSVNGKTSRGRKHKANVSKNETQKEYRPKVSKSKNAGPRESLATPKPRKPRFLLWWSPTGKMFDQDGKLLVPSNSESHVDCS